MCDKFTLEVSRRDRPMLVVRNGVTTLEVNLFERIAVNYGAAL